jgi:protoporphyrinogen oxidase
MSRRRVAVLGAGPSGLSVAWRLADESDSEATVLEASEAVGGLSRTIEREGLRFDIGPHRLSAQLPEMLAAVRELLGPSLIEKRNYHGVYFAGRLYNYPPRPGDFADISSLRHTLVFGSSWLAARALGVCRKLLGLSPRRPDFERVLRDAFGHAFAETVIFPMIAKVWGTRDLHAEFARLRFQLPTVASFVLRLFRKSARLNSRYFYYPQGGFGEIWERVAAHVRKKGGRIVLGARIERIECESLAGPFAISYRTSEGDGERTIVADSLVSSIPNGALLGYLAGTGLVADILPLAGRFVTRTLRLGIFLVRDYHIPTRVIIFPEGRFIFNRISEMNLFADLGNPEGHALLMIDVIADHGGEIDTLPDGEFNERLLANVLELGWFARDKVVRAFSVRIPEAYPVLSRERYDAQERIEAFFANTGVVLAGREASSDYNNAHNAIAKGFLAADYVAGRIDYAEYAGTARILGRLPIQD